MSISLDARDVCVPFVVQTAPYLAFESRCYAVFYKPAGMHSVPLFAEDSGESLLSWVRVHYPLLESAFGALGPGSGSAYLRAKTELGMLSRLDRETSGLIAFARSPEAFFAAMDSKTKTAGLKRYLLLAGKAPGESGVPGSRPPRIEIGEGDPFAAGREFSVESFFRSYGPHAARVACFLPGLEKGGKNIAGTGSYSTQLQPLPMEVEGKSLGVGVLPPLAAAEAVIHRGFRHQIRAHMAWCGHPILGDGLYGGAGAARLYLECHRLELKNPEGELEEFELYGADWRNRCLGAIPNPFT